VSVGKSPAMLSRWGSCHVVHMDRGHVSLLMANVTWTDLDPLAFILHFLNKIWIAARLVCSLCEAMAGSLFMATTSVSSSKVAVVDSGEVARSAVYSRYNNGLRTLPWGMPALTVESSVYSVPAFMSKCLHCK
jgi:hypothetical protein